MVKNLSEFKQKAFNTGLNVVDSQLSMSDADLTIADNVDFTDTGGVKSIDGLTAIGGTIQVNSVDATKILGGCVFNGYFYLMASNGTVARLVYKPSTTWVEANAQNFDKDALVNFATYNSKLWFVNGLTTNSNVVHFLDTSNTLTGLTAAASGLTAGTTLTLHLERMWIATLNKIYVSKVYPAGVATDWDTTTAYSGADTAGLIQLDNDPNDYIQTMVKMFSNLVVMRRNSINIITGQTVLQMVIDKDTNARTGVFAARSVSKADQAMYFLSDQGVKQFNGQTVKDGTTNFDTISTDRIDRKIQTYIDAIATPSAMVGYAFKDRYYLSDPANSTIYVFNELSGGWTRWTSMKAEVFLDLNGVLYCASVKNFYSVNTNASASIASTIKTKDYNLGNDFFYKVFEKLIVIFRTLTSSHSFTITWYLDGSTGLTSNLSVTVSSSSVVWDTGGYTWDANPSYQWDSTAMNFDRKTQRKLKTGRTITFRIDATGTNRFSLDSIDLIFEQIKRGGF